MNINLQLANIGTCLLNFNLLLLNWTNIVFGLFFPCSSIDFQNRIHCNHPKHQLPTADSAPDIPVFEQTWLNDVFWLMEIVSFPPFSFRFKIGFKKLWKCISRIKLTGLEKCKYCFSTSLAKNAKSEFKDI